MKERPHRWAEKQTGGDSGSPPFYFTSGFDRNAMIKKAQHPTLKEVARKGGVPKNTVIHYGPVPFWDTGRNQVVLLTRRSSMDDKQGSVRRLSR